MVSDDEQLMARLRAGDSQALADAYDRHAPLVHTIALRLVGDHHDAEDVTQQVFLALWQARESLDPQSGSLGGWLTTVTRRRCADQHDARSRERRRELAVVSVAGRVTGPPDPADVAERVFLAHEVAALGHPRATIVRLAIMEGQRHEDIAARLELPLGTVKSHVRRGLLALRRRLTEVSP